MKTYSGKKSFTFEFKKRSLLKLYIQTRRREREKKKVYKYISKKSQSLNIFENVREVDFDWLTRDRTN
jgi:hypothetical protein